MIPNPACRKEPTPAPMSVVYPYTAADDVLDDIVSASVSLGATERPLEKYA